MTSVFAPVREARVAWQNAYHEQLSLTTDDIAPWLLGAGRPLPLGSERPLHPRAASAEQPRNTTAAGSHDLGRALREPTAEGV